MAAAPTSPDPIAAALPPPASTTAAAVAAAVPMTRERLSLGSTTGGVGTTMAMTGTGAAAVGALVWVSGQYGHPVPPDVAVDMVVLAAGLVHAVTSRRRTVPPAAPVPLPTTESSP